MSRQDTTDPSQESLRAALKTVAGALKQGDLPFALMGGYAAYARGAPEPSHDVDFLVAEEDADRARKALAEQGLDVREPPEDWLFKVQVDDVTVDVIFRAGGEWATPDDVASADELEVLSVQMPVLSATTTMAHKLRVLDEHYCDFAALLTVARALREQVDWGDVATRTEGNDFAAAFLFLARRLRLF